MEVLSEPYREVLLLAGESSLIRRYDVPVGCVAVGLTAASVILEMGGPTPAHHPKAATPSYVGLVATGAVVVNGMGRDRRPLAGVWRGPGDVCCAIMGSWLM